MKMINDLKDEMNRMRKIINFIETEAKGNEFCVSDFDDNQKAYFMNGASMTALVRRNIVEVVETREGSYKRPMWVDGQYKDVIVPCTINVYKQIHDYEWYKKVMLKTLIDIVENA